MPAAEAEDPWPSSASSCSFSRWQHMPSIITLLVRVPPSCICTPFPVLYMPTTAPPRTGPSVVSSRRRTAFQPCPRSLLSPSSLSFAPSPPHQRQHDHLEGRRWQLLPLAAAGGKGFGKKSSKEGEGESSKQQPTQQGASKVGRALQMNEQGSATSHSDLYPAHLLPHNPRRTQAQASSAQLLANEVAKKRLPKLPPPLPAVLLLRGHPCPPGNSKCSTLATSAKAET